MPAPDTDRTAEPGERHVLSRYAVLTGVLLGANMARLAGDVLAPGLLAGAWLGVALTVYTALAVLVVFLPLGVVDLVLRWKPVARALAGVRVRADWVAPLLALLATTALQLLVHVDVVVHDMYGFHINGFVWNLITTPGGLESLGASTATHVTFGAIALGYFLAQAALLYAAARSRPVIRILSPLGRRRVAVGAFCALFVLSAVEKLTYGMADVRNERSVLQASRAVPFYFQTTIRSFAASMGWMAERDEIEPLELADSGLDYPLAPIVRAPDHRNWNIVWLVAESLRADALDPEIMPEATAFAARSLDFRHHYSGGNGTRMGVFSMFYGLYGSYWFSFLGERRGPAFIEVLCDADYDITARTSAKFTYPEFDSTVWVRVPGDRLQEGDPDLPGWQNDQAHVGRLLADLDARDPDRPFLQFLFFESAHARYYFPDESVVREPYLESVNYATMDVERDAELLHNRYLNSCHHLDLQLGRVFTGLEERGLLDSTIVVVTGDHGEEFMEKGNWGHHATFSEESTRVPLLMFVPGQAPQRVTRLTSHLDIVPTVMTLLGVINPLDDYCLGYDLLSPYVRESCVVADWERLAIVDATGKGILPVRGGSFLDSYTTDLDDGPLDDPDAWMQQATGLISDVVTGLGRFVR